MRSAAYILMIFILLGASGVLLADQTLTVTLDPTQSEAGKKADLALKHETLGATRAGAQQQALSSRSSGYKQVPIGRLGVVIASKAEIRRLPSPKGQILYACPKDTSLALVGEHGSWYGILMIDSSTGWVEKSKVQLLNYQVVGQPSKTNGLGNNIVNTALKYLGIPYKWGGYSFNGLDCSGFVKAVFASHGINLPRVARDQANVGTPVSASQLQPGDRLYFACKGGEIDHAGIYIGNGLFIHSSASRGGVAVDNIMKPFYANALVTARR